MKYECELCGLVYDEEIGDPKRGIPAGTAFADLPEHYECPSCGSQREAFNKTAKRKSLSTPPKQTDAAFWRDAKYHDCSNGSDR